MKKVQIVVMTEDEYNDIRINVKSALSDAEKLSNDCPSYLTGRIWGRLRRVLEVLDREDGENHDGS